MPEVYALKDEVLAAWPGLAKLAEAEQDAIVADANARVRDLLKRDVLLGPRVDVLSGRAHGRLWLAAPAIASIESIAVNGQVLDDQGGAAWTFDPDTGALLRGDGTSDPRFAPWWPKGFRNVRVEYTAGYDPVPGMIRRATIAVARGLDAALKTLGPYKSESIGDYSYTLADGSTGSAPGPVEDWLAPYLPAQI